MDIHQITLLGWFCGIVAAILIGMGKTGLTGAGTIAIPIMAFLFGGKPSTGILLPLLCMADIFAVIYYHRHADWKQLYKILPWALAGIIIGAFVGNYISALVFKRTIGIIVLLSVAIMLWSDFRKSKSDVPKSVWYSALFGLSGGFSTMIGNAAGPIMTMYMQSMKLLKNNYIGTSAWFFLIVNFSKIPLQIFVWKNITLQTLTFDLILLPAIALGAYLGIILVKMLPDKTYRVFILVSTAISALFLL